MSEPTIIGLDLSLTGTGIATENGEHTHPTPASWPMERRLVSIRDEVELHYCTMEPPHLFVIEDFVTRSPAASTLGMVHGVVRVALVEAGVPFVLVPPATLKKYVTGKGTATKADMRMAVYQRFDIDLADDNQVDAYGLRAMGLDAFGSPLAQLPAAQRESLEKVAWPEIQATLTERTTA